MQASRTNCLNLIRLLAAFQVMFGHALEHLKIDVPDVLSKVLGMFQGVPIFFALSGFLIWFSIGRSEDWKNYFKKRFWRIYPELWIGIAVETIVLLLLYHVTDIIEFILFIFGQATIFQFWTPDSLRGYGCGTPNGSLWTICVIIQFYVIAWGMHKLLHGKTRRKWVGTWCVVLLFGKVLEILLGRFAPAIVNKLYDQTIIRYLWLFMIGCFLAEFFAEIIPCLKKYWAVFIIIAGLVYIVGVDMHAGYGVLQSIFLFAGVVGFAYRFPQLDVKRDISYGIYIFHMTVVNTMLARGVQGRIVHLFVVCVVTCLLAVFSSEVVRRIWCYKNQCGFHMNYRKKGEI